MKAQLETHDGKLTLKVYYDPALFNWDEAKAAGLASFGLKHGEAAVLALPFPNPGDKKPADLSRLKITNFIKVMVF